MKLFYITLLLFQSFVSFSQYTLVENIIVYADDEAMHFPFFGGMNTPQFSQIDINQDGNSDLYIYDGSAYKHLVLLNTGVPGEYKYAPEFEKNFPVAEDWALLQDFNCDNIPDFLAYKNGGTTVYKGIVMDGIIQFELYKERLVYTTTIEIPIYTARTDISTFTDVDDDGDMDVLAFAVSGTFIRFYKNKSAELGFGCDSLIYEIADYCWGQINEGAICSGAELGVACLGGEADDMQYSRMHIGSTMLAFDQDNDADLDMILGDVSCDNLVYYENGGTASSAQMLWKDSLFPSYDIPLKLPEFPAAYMVDADNDGLQDILVSPNEFALGLNIENVWFYKNISTEDSNMFALQSDKYFTNDLVDAGTVSKPVFFDYNADGLMDILIGVRNTLGADNEKKYGLWLYENIGSAELAAYSFITNDYGGLAEYLISDLAPFPVDLDSDGDMDLLIGMYDGTFIFLENIAGIGVAAIFDAPEFNYQSLDVGGYAVPSVFDVNSDGLPDLISGKSAGTLHYYENTGTAASPVFTLISENWGGVDVRKPGSFEGFSAPFMYRNAENKMELLVGSFYGFIYLFDEIEESMFGEFHERDTFFLEYNPGFHSSVFGMDISGDGNQELLVGNLRGGVQIFAFDDNTEVNEVNAHLQIQVFPNPATDLIFLNGFNSQNTIVELYDITGQRMHEIVYTNGSLSVSALSPGMYFIRVITDGNLYFGTFIKN